MLFDVATVGGGPAGLSATLMLRRCRRRIVVCDTGNPRSAASRALHGYLTRDGITPTELLAHGRRELEAYEVPVRRARVIDARPAAHGFDVALEFGEHLAARKLLIATGVVDRLPDVPGLADCYGRSVFHCPYCDGAINKALQEESGLVPESVIDGREA